MKTMYRTRTYSPFVGLALEDIDLSVAAPAGKGMTKVIRRCGQPVAEGCP